MKIIIAGDTHAEWGKLNTLINNKKPDLILQCGDFGYWPRYDQFSMNHIKNGETRIYWCDGNHEDHEKLQSIKRNEVRPGIFYMRRGSTLTLPDSRVVLFMGGAESIDRGWRTPGLNWFHQEVISAKDLENLPNIKIDIVISHTCPLEFDLDPRFIDLEKHKDCSRVALSKVLEIYKPSLWYFGHYHTSMTGEYNGCRWTCLNMASDTGWWAKL